MLMQKFWDRLRSDTSGNATMLVAFAAPALIGGAGFAVDTAQWYLWKRELQHAVDQASYAGAIALSRGKQEEFYKKRIEQEYNINLAITRGFASMPTSKVVNYAGGNNNSLVVSASATRKLPFSSLLTGSATTIRVSAQTSFAAGASYSACIVSLAETGTGTQIGGNASVTAKCGIAALSCSEDAIVVDANATVETDLIATCGTVDAPDELRDRVVEGLTQLSDEYGQLEPPTNDTPRTYQCTGNGQRAQASLLPGTYPSLVVSCTTVLSAGIYVIDGGVLDLSANYNVTGTGVMFVLKNGAIIKLGGNGNNNSIKLSPMTATDVINAGYPALVDKYAGMLVFEDRNNNPKSPGHVLNGNSNSIIEGLIYMPSGPLTISGTADVSSQCLLVSAYTVTIQGGANLETLCPTDDSTEIGSGKPRVRMVA